MRYLIKPIIAIPIILTLLIGGIYVSDISETLGIGLSSLSIILMIVSFVEALFAKKWLKAFLYFIFYSTITFFAFILVVVSVAMGPQIIQGTTDFYNQKLNYHLKEEGKIDLKTKCKQDSIYGIGPGGGDYSASCIFILEGDDYKNLISLVNTSEEFKKMNIIEFDHQINLNELDCAKNIKFKNVGYQSVNGSMMYSKIVVSADNKYCYFNLDYF